MSDGRRGAPHEVFLGLVAAALVLTATASMERVFLDDTWRGAGWGATFLALAVAVIARRVRFGALGAAVASAAVFVVFTYVVHLEAGGLLPGLAQLSEFVDLVGSGFSDLLYEPAPARATPGLLLLVSTGCWVVTHTVHELCVRARRPGAGIVLAAVLWTFPLAVPQPPGRTWPQALPFLAAAGLALLVEPDPDLAGWRRQGARSAGPTSAGVAVGIVALLIATVAPGVLPGYGAEAWVDLRSADAARGYQPIVDVARRLNLPAPRDLLRVTADRPIYLRLAGLDTFDGATWRLGPADQSSFSPEEVIPADRDLPPEVAIGASEATEITVENLSLENVFVPAPYHPARIEGAAARRMVYSQEGTFIASSETLEGEPALVPGLSYGVEVTIPTPSPEDLAAVTMEAYADPRFAAWTALPADYAPLREVTQQLITESAATGPYEVAFALQDFFRDPERFRYSTDVEPLRSADALARFVTEERAGYCEYFATAMAVMLRQQGIPARVAVGFRTGDEVVPGEFVVSTQDAHAWVEVLFPGSGWIQFEPTPALADALVPTREDVTPELPIGFANEPLPANPQQPGEGDFPDPQGGTAAPAVPVPPVGGAGAEDLSGRWIGVGAVLLAALALGGALLSSRRRDDDLPDEDRILRAQRRLFRRARQYGLGRRDAETAHEVTRRWVAEGRVEPAAAARFAHLAQSAAFGGHLEDGQGVEAERLAGAVGAGLRGSVPASRRIVGPVRVPLEDAVAAGRRAATDLLDRGRR